MRKLGKLAKNALTIVGLGVVAKKLANTRTGQKVVEKAGNTPLGQTAQAKAEEVRRTAAQRRGDDVLGG